MPAPRLRALARLAAALALLGAAPRVGADVSKDPEWYRGGVIYGVTYWVREFDVDGFRVDAAWGIRRRAPAFWGEVRRHLERVKPGVFLLAEASACDPFYVRNGFDATYDWTRELGHWAWETGDEVGAEFQPYEKDAPPLSWVDAHGLRPLYRRLAALREELPALRRGAYRRVPVPDCPAAFVFVRDAGASGRALVVLNFGPATRLRLPVPGAVPSWDALGERPAAVRRAAGGVLEVDAGEKEALVLVPPPSR